MNLVTGVTSLTFNPTTEILAIASEKMKEAVRLVIFLYPSLLLLIILKFKLKTERLLMVKERRMLDYFKKSSFYR